MEKNNQKDRRKNPNSQSKEENGEANRLCDEQTNRQMQREFAESAQRQ